MYYVNDYREANRRFKKSLLAAYGVAITLRTGGEEGPARDILLKLVEEMDQVIFNLIFHALLSISKGGVCLSSFSK